MKDVNNLPAMPTAEWQIKGMTLRDHFAGLAMQGMLAAYENYTTCDLTKYAYQIADEMLKAREPQ